MKQMIIDRAFKMEVGEMITIEFATYKEARSFQTGMSSALGKAPPILRGSLLVALNRPNSDNTLEKFSITITKMAPYDNATITLKNGTTINLQEYDYKIKSDNDA